MKRRGMRGDDGWSEHGGYMQAKKTKLKGQFSNETTVTSSLFRGVSIYVNGYTVPPASQLRSLIIQHGGLYQAYYSRATVTHIVANRLPTMKINRLTDQKVVRANWITDSIQAKKLLPWQQYELYPNRCGGVGQQQLQVIPVQAHSTNDTSSDEPTSVSESAQGICDPQLPTDMRVARDPVVSAENLTALPVPTRVRRVQQMRLDACLSPPKPTSAASGTVTVSSGQAAGPSKSTKQISLKQLLQAGMTSVSTAIEPPLTAISPEKTVDSCSTSPDSHTALVAGSSPPSSVVESRADQQLATFYARSRLHHLSSWANELHQLVNQLRENPNHRCDLGEMWKQTVLQEPSPLETDLCYPVVLRLEARLSNHSASSSISVPPAPPPPPRIVFHIDMDCFFVSVSLRDRPDLKDKPVAVTHAKQRESEQSTNQRFRRNAVNSMSEIASCSYAARRAGCKNGMLLGRAKQLCPDLQTVPYDFDAYKAVSETLYTIVARFTLAIEAVSCDELYADCTELLTLPGLSTEPELGKPQFRDGCWSFEYRMINPLVLGAHLRDLVQKQTRGCTASIGFGTTRLLARLATKRAKPDGQWFLLGLSGSSHAGCVSSLIQNMDRHWQWQCVSDPMNCPPAPLTSINPLPVASCELTGEDARWFGNLPIRELPGIGHVLVERLADAFGVHTCGEMMRTVTRNQLIRVLGAKTGARIYDLCHGRDEGGQLQFVRHSKSVSACMNYGIRLQSHSELDSLVKSLCQELVSRMAQTTCASTSDAGGSRGVSGRCLIVRVFVRAPNAPAESAKFMGHGICNKASRMHSFPEPTADVTLLHRTTLSLLRHLCPDPKELRGLGLQMNKLSASGSVPILRKPVIPKLTVTASEMSPQPPKASIIPSHSSEEVNLKPVSIPSPHLSEDTTCSEPIGTPQLARRRSLRLKRRGSPRNSPANAKSNTDPGNASEPVPMNTESDPVVPVCASPATPPHHNQDDDFAFKNDFRMNQPIAEPPVCSTPRHPNRPSLITTTVAAPSRRLVSKQTRGGGSTSRNRTAHPSKSGSPKKIPTVSESTPGVLTQALSNPTVFFEGKSLNQLKQIFADWITSEPYPLLEDVCILATYLIRLVPFNLDRVRRCLVILNRLISELHEPSAAKKASQSDWRYAYRRIGETVSLAVNNCYGDVKLQLQLCKSSE